MKRLQRVGKSNSKRVAFTRFMLVVAGFVVWIGGISVRLVHLQVTQHTWLREKAQDNRENIKETRALRGTIYDRNGRALAMSSPVKTLYADPVEMSNIEVTSKVLAKALKLDAAQVGAQLQKAKEGNKRYVVLAKRLDEETVQKINKSVDDPSLKKADTPNREGLHWQDDQKRSYPNGTLAAQVVGASNDSNAGIAGVEQSQENILHGAVIEKLQKRDRLGRVFDESYVERETPGDVVLTLDSAFQYMTEQALAKGVADSGSKSGIAIVMSVKTGEILALANHPTFDPNLLDGKSKENVRNNAIQSQYAPGSAFKIVTYGSALEKKLFSPDDLISSGNGTIKVADHVFTDSHGVGTVTYSQAMAHSSNVCAIKTALSVGREDFASMVQKMGFGSKTGIELPAETPGRVHPVGKWNGDSLASLAIGYEIGVTPLQMISAFATIANNGVRIQPHIIKEIRHSAEQPKTLTQPQQTQIITAETARNLRTMLKQVVLTGTGRRAQLNGYSAAGKTGTAWKFDGNSIDSSKYISSFIGMAPADDPEIVVAVIMDEPTKGVRDGGVVAAPVFRDIAQRLLYELKVQTDAPIRQERFIEKDIAESKNDSSVSDKKAKEPRPDSELKNKKSTPPAGKEKSKDLTKTNQKKSLVTSKLAARQIRRFDLRNLRSIDRTKIET